MYGPILEWHWHTFGGGGACGTRELRVVQIKASSVGGIAGGWLGKEIFVALGVANSFSWISSPP